MLPSVPSHYLSEMKFPLDVTTCAFTLLALTKDKDWGDHNGYTALSEAAMAGHTVVVGQLLRADADPNLQAQWAACGSGPQRRFDTPNDSMITINYII